MTKFEKGIATLTGLAATAAIIDFFSEKVNFIKPILQFVLDFFNYPIPVFTVLIALVVFLIFRKLIANTNSANHTQEKTGLLILNGNCEARYSYFVDRGRITLNYLHSEDGYTLYCTTHDLRLNNSGFTGDLTCPDCSGRKFIGSSHDDIISRIERQIKRSINAV